MCVTLTSTREHFGCNSNPAHVLNFQLPLGFLMNMGIVKPISVLHFSVREAGSLPWSPLLGDC